MNIEISEKVQANILQKLFPDFKDNYSEDCHEGTLHIQNEDYNIIFKTSDFHNGSSIFFIKGSSKDSINISFINRADDILRFIYVIHGEILYRKKNQDEKTISNQQGATIFNNKSIKHTLEIKPSENNTILLFEIYPKEYYETIECEIGFMPDKYKKLLDPKSEDIEMMRVRNLSIELTDIIDEFFDDDHKGIIRRTYFKSLSSKLFAAQLEHFMQVKQKVENSFISETDRNTLLEARQYIKDNYSKNLTIIFLSRKFAINQQKLKVGFKKLFGTTINKFLQNVRLEKSKLFLSNPDLKIYEISSMIGYKNKSYYAKKFKEKYNSTPKEYQLLMKNNMELNRI